MGKDKEKEKNSNDVAQPKEQLKTIRNVGEVLKVQTLPMHNHLCNGVCVCVCLCMRERERKRKQ